MNKLISVIAVSLLFISGAARADKVRSAGSHSFLKEHNIKLGLDTEVGVPLGNYSDVNGVGGGVSLNGEMALLEQVAGTLRIGFQAHLNRTLGGFDSHVNAIPMLLGTKYYVGSDHQGMFGAFELGMFDLMSSDSQGTVTHTANNLRFGMGAGIGIQQSQWNARVSVHTQDVGNFGNAMIITGGIGYQFAGI
jgi:hypothetical protein